MSLKNTMARSMTIRGTTTRKKRNTKSPRRRLLDLVWVSAHLLNSAEVTPQNPFHVILNVGQKQHPLDDASSREGVAPIVQVGERVINPPIRALYDQTAEDLLVTKQIQPEHHLAMLVVHNEVMKVLEASN
jgi:hypothetical protein